MSKSIAAIKAAIRAIRKKREAGRSGERRRPVPAARSRPGAAKSVKKATRNVDPRKVTPLKAKPRLVKKPGAKATRAPKRSARSQLGADAKMPRKATPQGKTAPVAKAIRATKRPARPGAAKSVKKATRKVASLSDRIKSAIAKLRRSNRRTATSRRSNRRTATSRRSKGTASYAAKRARTPKRNGLFAAYRR